MVHPQAFSLPPTPRSRCGTPTLPRPANSSARTTASASAAAASSRTACTWRRGPVRALSITAEFTVRPEHQGAPGLAHGGILATALDETLGSLNWLLRTIAVTGRLETDFVRPVPVGTTLHLEAEVTAVAGRKIYSTATGRVGGPDGPVAVRADALFIEVKVERFVNHGRDEEIQAAMNDPDQLRRARAFEVNP
ncbi:hypothetical protein SGLAM104S_06788 [Streptomyces glaucescens]